MKGETDPYFSWQASNDSNPLLQALLFEIALLLLSEVDVTSQYKYEHYFYATLYSCFYSFCFFSVKIFLLLKKTTYDVLNCYALRSFHLLYYSNQKRLQLPFRKKVKNSCHQAEPLMILYCDFYNPSPWFQIWHLARFFIADKKIDLWSCSAKMRYNKLSSRSVKARISLALQNIHELLLKKIDNVNKCRGLNFVGFSQLQVWEPASTILHSTISQENYIRNTSCIQVVLIFSRLKPSAAL